MLETLAVILVLMWLLGMVTSYTMAGFIHLLLLLALVVVVIRLIRPTRHFVQGWVATASGPSPVLAQPAAFASGGGNRAADPARHTGGDAAGGLAPPVITSPFRMQAPPPNANEPGRSQRCSATRS